MLIGLTKPMSANPPIQYRAVLTKEEALSPTPTYNDRHYPLPPSFNLARPNLSISPPVTGNTTKPSINYSSTNVTFRECWEAIYIYIYIYIYTGRTAVAQWLRCCATNPKVAGSIPAGFINIKSFRSHYGPGVDSASNRNEYQEHFLRVKAAGA